MMRRLAAAFLLFGVTLLAACHPFSPDDARICRAILPAINPPDATISVTRSSVERGTIHITYQAAAHGRVRTRFIVCQFVERPSLSEAHELIRVTTEQGVMNVASLYFLKRFYLTSPEALWNEPQDVGRSNLVTLPATAALAIQHVLAAFPSLAIYALIAASYALIYGLIGRILFGFGEFAVIGGTAATILMVAGIIVSPSFPLTVSLIGIMMGLAAAAWHGLAAERLVIAPLIGRACLPILIATTGLTITLAEYVRLAQGSAGRWLSPLLSFPLAVARSASFSVTVTPIGIVATGLGLCATAALVRVMRVGSFGRAWRALADDRDAAALCGIDARAIFTLAFILATALSGLAGILTALAFGGVGYAQGMTLTLKALTGAILGGIGSVRGAVWGGIALGLFEALWSATMPIESRDIAVYTVLALVLILRPGGFFGEGAGSPRPV
jgi:branched-chain amino acid transport system permease protein